MPGQNFGYCRVSSSTQNLERQLDGVQLDRMFSEKMSGKDASSRPVLQECLSFLREDDTLHIHSIDRLARSVADLEKIVSELTAKGVIVHFHKENIIFSSDKEDAMSRLLFHLLSSVAQFERTLIVERRREGVAIALKNGVKFGRPEKLTEAQKEQIRTKAATGDSKGNLAREFSVSRQTVYAVLKQAVQVVAHG